MRSLVTCHEDRISIPVVRVFASESFSQKSGDVDHSSLDSEVCEERADFAHAEGIPMVFVDLPNSVFRPLMHLEEAEANGPSGDAAKLGDHSMQPLDGQMLQKIVEKA